MQREDVLADYSVPHGRDESKAKVEVAFLDFSCQTENLAEDLDREKIHVRPFRVTQEGNSFSCN